MQRRLLCLLVLVVAASFVSGGFLLHAGDLHLPASSEPWDAAIYPWNFFWLEQWLPDSLGGDDANLLFTTRLGWPRGEGLGLYTPTWVYDVVALPFQWASDAPEARHAAVAALLWLSSVATALLAYALAREVHLTRPGALLVALLAVAASGRLMNAARLNLFCTEFLLLYLFTMRRWWRKGGAPRAIGYGFASTLLLLQSQPLFFQAAILTALLLLAVLCRREGRARLRERLPSLVPAAILFLLLTAPFLWEMLRELPHSPAQAQFAALAVAGSLDPADLVIPSTADRFAGAYSGLVALRPPSFFEQGGPLGTVSHFLGLGWIVLIVLGITARDGRGARRAALVALALLLLAMGPLLHWRGHLTSMRLPYAVLNWIPPLALEKSPTRFVWLVELLLAIAAARGLERLAFTRREVLEGGVEGERRLRPLGASIAALLAVLTLAEQGETLPLRSIEPRIRIPAEVRELACDQGRYAVLDLPYDHPGNVSHAVNGLAMAFGAYHERPIFFGLYPRAARASEPELQARTLFRLIARCEQAARDQSGPPAFADDELAAARKDVYELRIGAIQVHDVTFDPGRRDERPLLRDLVRRLKPLSEKTLEPGKGYSLTLFRF